MTHIPVGFGRHNSRSYETPIQIQLGFKWPIDTDFGGGHSTEYLPPTQAAMQQEEVGGPLEDGSASMHGTSTRNVKGVECYEEGGAGEYILANDTCKDVKLTNAFHRLLNFDGSADDDDIPSCSSLKLESCRQSKDNVCSICKKSFPSMKSLSGHMRCHPERAWRGIQPPPSFAGQSLSSTTDDSLDRKTDDSVTIRERSASGHARSLSSWVGKGKRSQRVAAAVVGPAGDGSQDPASDAADGLLHLAGTDRLDSSPLNKGQRNEELEAADTDFVQTEANIHDDNEHVLENGSESASVSTDAGPKTRLVSGDLKQGREEESEGKNMNHYKHRNQNRCMAAEVGNQKRKVKDIKPLAESKYVCSTCNKSFPCHQALGGHSAGHKKFKNDFLSNVKSDEVTVQVEVERNPPSIATSSAAGSKVLMNHKCNVCNKGFPTGQALGGHKRLHWVRPLDDPASSIASQEEVAKAGRRPLNFDLNELPDCAESLGF